MIREKLTNGNKWCHIYTDNDGITNYHNTETNETYRVIPDKSALGFHLEYHKDGELRARNSVSFDEMKCIALLAGSNHLLKNLVGGEQEQLCLCSSKILSNGNIQFSLCRKCQEEMNEHN